MAVAAPVFDLVALDDAHLCKFLAAIVNEIADQKHYNEEARRALRGIARMARLEATELLLNA